MSSGIKSIKDAEKGFILIEILIAVLIFSLTAVSVFTIYIPSNIWIKKAGQQTKAVNYASAVIENLRDHNENLYEVLAVTPDDKNLNLNYHYKPDDIIAKITINLHDKKGLGNLYDVNVTASWVEDESEHHVVLSTIIRKNQ